MKQMEIFMFLSNLGPTCLDSEKKKKKKKKKKNKKKKKKKQDCTDSKKKSFSQSFTVWYL